MSASELFSRLLVSGDGHIEELDVDNLERDPATGNLLATGLISLPMSQLGEIGEAIELSQLSTIKKHAEWTSRSVGARLGFEVHEIHGETIMQGDDALQMWAKFALKPAEDREGRSIDSPLPPYLKRWMEQSRIKCGRLFMRPLERGALEEEEIQREMELGMIDINGSTVLKDGVALPSYANERYPLRFDLMNKTRLQDAFLGSGRGTMDAIQPRIPENAVLQPGAFGVTATRCSLVLHRGVLEPNMIECKTGKGGEVIHGTSRLWDPGRTTGIGNARHLEAQNTSQKSVDLSEYAVKLSLYPAPPSHGVVSQIVSRSSSKVGRRGLDTTLYLEAEENRGQCREILADMQRRDDVAGLLVGGRGVSVVRKEVSQIQQDRAAVAAAERYACEADISTPVLHRSLCEYTKYMSDANNQAILFARQAPAPDKIQQMMDSGVRTIVTENVSGDSDKIYLSSDLLGQYRVLAEKGLQLFLVTPTSIRKFWHTFFVDVQAIDRMQNADARVCIYGASAEGGDKLLERARYPEFLQAIKADFPNVAIVTGAAKNGAMKYGNDIARSLGITTIGVANHIKNQETTEDDLDAGMFFNKHGFNPRQELMARTTALPLVGPGAQGSEHEGSIERTLAKISKNQTPPIIYIDPVGLGKYGRHLWAPVKELEEYFAAENDIDGIGKIQLTRSPFVANITKLHTSYVDAYNKDMLPFMRDPIAFWKKNGVPEDNIKTGMERAIEDARLTGLPIPIYLQPVLRELGMQ